MLVTAAWYRARAELRRRWRSTILLVLLVGLVGGITLTTVAGARRSSTAYERFRDETLAGDLDIAPSDPTPESFDRIAALPQVVAMARPAFPFIVPADSGLYPFLDFLAVAGQDERFGTVVDRPRMIAGRLPDPDRSEEMAISEQFASEADLDPGDEVTFESYAWDQVEALFSTGDAGPPAGPRVTLTVTGVASVPYFLGESTGAFQPRVILTPAFLQEHEDDMGVYPGGATVRLRNGSADVPAVMQAVRDLYAGDSELELAPASIFSDKIDDGIQVLVLALVLATFGVGVVGTIVVGQALVRHLAHAPDDDRNLAALGMERRERAFSLFAGALPVGVAGALLAVAGALVASPTMPVGLARRAEPDPGFSADWPVLGFGAIGILLVVAALAALASWSATRTAADRALRPARRIRPSAVHRATARAGLGPPEAMGIGMALDLGDRGPRATPARSTLAAVSIGVAGVVGVTVFAASLGTLVETPGRYGFPWHALVAGFQGELLRDTTEALLDDPDAREVTALTTSLAHLGTGDLNIHAFEPLKGSTGPTLVSGRLPQRADEVALGSGSMRDAGVGVGGTVELEGPGAPVRLRVVGRVSFPVVDDRSAVDRGAVLTADGLRPLATPDSLNRDLLVSWAEGIDVERANAGLAERTGAEVTGLRIPSEVNNLRLIQGVPRAMIAVLALFTALSAAHAVVSTVRRRRQDLAVLRSLGFVGRQLGPTLAAQATALAVAGLGVGVPLGVVGGRLAWRALAQSIGVIDQTDVPVWALAAVVGLALVLVNLMALRPARRARRIPAATILRTG